MVIDSNIVFAQASDSSGGIGAFNINLKSFIFQLVTFVIVLLIFKKWLLPPITRTLEERQKTLEESLTNAQKTEEALRQAESKAAETLQAARAQADQALVDAQTEARKIISQAETKGEEAADRIRKDAEDFLAQHGESLRQELKSELVALVAQTTAKVIEQKMTPQEDTKLIQEAIKVLPR